MSDKDKYLTAADKKLWHLYIEQENIASEKEGHDEEIFSELLNLETDDTASKDLDILKIPKRSHLPQKSFMKQQDELDRRTLEKLKKGKLAIEASLDLHGLTKIQAYTALQEFIIKSFLQGRRCVLIITGKGKPRLSTEQIFDREEGVLKQNVPLWLQENNLNSIVLNWQNAKPKDGGTGALYVYLKRKK